MVALAPPDGPELVLGLVAPVGVDLRAVTAALRSALHTVGYEAIDVNVIDAAAALGRWKLNDEPRYDIRANARMTFGNEVRADIGLDGLALVAIGDVQRIRLERNGQADKPIPRAAYLVRSLKTPDEVKKLRDVYGNSCFIVATYASRDVQLETLARQIAISHHSAPEGFRAEAAALMLRDESERGVETGQNLRDTFPLADVFLGGGDNETLKSSALRFVEILFGHPFRTPTKQELGMFFAHGAALRSASPGRQVGACIATKDGDTVSIGTNEVPKAHGGQYWEGDDPDERDHHRSHDSTALLTQNILADLISRLRQKGWLNGELEKLDLATLLKRVDTDSVLKKMPRGKDDPPSLTEKALLRDIIEFMRAVHAEMAAISSAAKRGVSVDGCIMYATAFPCHECARHIVVVGISEVYFIDPYPKSRVPEMFEDSIVVDREAKGKIPFRAFTGIAPRLYADGFSAPNRRDGDKWVDWEQWRTRQMPRKSASPNMYLEKEDEALNLLKKRIAEKARGIQ
jgi:deoxycytidylate deaminase